MIVFSKYNFASAFAHRNPYTHTHTKPFACCPHYTKKMNSEFIVELVLWIAVHSFVRFWFEAPFRRIALVLFFSFRIFLYFTKQHSTSSIFSYILLFWSFQIFISSWCSSTFKTHITYYSLRWIALGPLNAMVKYVNRTMAFSWMQVNQMLIDVIYCWQFHILIQYTACYIVGSSQSESLILPPSLSLSMHLFVVLYLSVVQIQNSIKCVCFLHIFPIFYHILSFTCEYAAFISYAIK